jgi:ElaB protein
MSTKTKTNSHSRTAPDSLGDVASEKFDALRERVSTALDHGKESLEDLRVEATKRARQADELVRENPYYAIGIAAGVGALIGLFMAHRYHTSR